MSSALNYLEAELEGAREEAAHAVDPPSAGWAEVSDKLNLILPKSLESDKRMPLFKRILFERRWPPKDDPLTAIGRLNTELGENDTSNEQDSISEPSAREKRQRIQSPRSSADDVDVNVNVEVEVMGLAGCRADVDEVEDTSDYDPDPESRSADHEDLRDHEESARKKQQQSKLKSPGHDQLEDLDLEVPGAGCERKGRGEKWQRWVLLSCGGNCFYCKDPRITSNLPELLSEWEIDHLEPRSEGGKSALQNLVAACKNCNLRKSDLSHRAFIKRFKGENSGSGIVADYVRCHALRKNGLRCELPVEAGAEKYCGDHRGFVWPTDDELFGQIYMIL